MATYFTQVTDIHLGGGWRINKLARPNFEEALQEMASAPRRPAVVLATGDLACAGTRSELQLYADVVSQFDLPIAALPANHDLWGEPDASAWLDLIGPMRRTVDCGDLRFLLLDAHHRRADKSWHAVLDPEQAEWLRQGLREWAPRPVVVAIHPPALPDGDEWHDVWRGSNAPGLLQILREAKVVALVTGHWHRNAEWTVHGVRQTNTGALAGWQYHGIPPYHYFPTRAGYRWFCWDGDALRTFWREFEAKVQVNLVSVGEAHTGGPRPQVRPPILGGRAAMHVEAWSQGDEIATVEWSVTSGDWRPMEAQWRGLWSEWSAPIEARDFRVGEATLVVRATTAAGRKAFDAVPLRLEGGHSPSVVRSGPEMVFELFYPPK